MVVDAGTRMDSERERALAARSRFDASAFAELYDFDLPRVSGFVARRVGDRAAAEDVFQETFLQVHRTRHTYNPAYPVIP